MFEILSENKANFQDYKRLIAKIPAAWKEAINADAAPIAPFDIQVTVHQPSRKPSTTQFSKTSCSTIAHTIMHNSSSHNNVDQKHRRWEEFFNNFPMEEKTWEKVFTSLAKNARVKKAYETRWFVLSRTFITAPTLFNCRAIPSPACKRCGYWSETLEHAFYHCTSSSKLLDYVVLLLDRLHPQLSPFNKTVQLIILGPDIVKNSRVPTGTELLDMYFTTVTTLRVKYNETPPDKIDSVTLFKSLFTKRLNFLQQSAKVQKSLPDFLRMWAPIYQDNGNLLLP